MAEIGRVNRTSTIAWAPVKDLIASASVSGTLGETFETTAALEVFRWRASEARLELVSSTSAPDRFHALAWGRAAAQHGHGLLAGGLTNGVVSVWDAALLEEGPVASLAKHAGAVTALDFNPTMTSLLASSGADGQLLIWDLASAAKPSVYVPGARVKAVSDAMPAVAWNRAQSVPHILAGALSSGSCEIWDLKNKKQVIAFHDAKRCNASGQRSLAWHPTEPTMIVQVSDDDLSPVVLLWDLKHYAAPVAVLQGHKRGITSVAWSSDDPTLILTSSRDGTALIWDLPNSKVRSHLSNASSSAPAVGAADAPFHTQVAFAPLVRGHVATASSDGHVRVHALIDPGPKGRTPAAALGAAPNWLLRPCGASFGFGGRLLRFNATSRSVKIAPVVTDQELVDSARLLQQQTASTAVLTELCETNSADANRADGIVWSQLAARLHGVAREAALQQAIGVVEVSGNSFELNPFDLAAAAAPWDGGSAPLWSSESDWEQQAGRLACAGKVSDAWQACAAAQQWPTALLLARELGGEEEYAKCRAAWMSSSSAPLLAKGILKALSGSKDALIAQGPLSEWKSLAAAALSWGGDRSSQLLSVLANRLKEAGDLPSAQLCAIAANDFESLATSWVGTNVSLTEAVRRLLCASRAFGVELAPPTSRLAHALSNLANALAAQGDLEGALHWLKQIHQPATAPPQIRLLYERLCTAKAPLAAPVAAAAAPAPAATRPGPSVFGLPTTAPTSTQPMARPAPFTPTPVPFVPTFSSPAPSPVTTSSYVAPVVQVQHPTPFVRPVPPPSIVPVATVPTYNPPEPSAPAPQPVVSAAAAAQNSAIAAVFERLTRGAEQLATSGDQNAKIADEVVKRIPTLKTKLDSLSPSVTEPIVGLLEALANALESFDGAAAAQLYADAQQHHHTILGSTGMLALKRINDLIQKARK